MSERYKPRDLKRGIVRDGHRELSGISGPSMSTLKERSFGGRVQHVEVVFRCNHGEPWTVCTLCSKPRG